MKVFGYLRVSGDSQIEKDGPDRQRAAIEAYCKRRGWTIIEFFFDGGISGATEAAFRPEFAQMIERANEAQAIVAENGTRLARDLMVSELLMAQCRKVGLQVYTTDQDTELASDENPTAVAFRQIFAVFAQWDKAQLVARLRAARIRLNRHGAARPYGRDAKEQAIQDAIRKLISQGFTSPSTIARLLNEAHLFNRIGEPWEKTAVWKLIKRFKERGVLTNAE